MKKITLLSILAIVFLSSCEPQYKIEYKDYYNDYFAAENDSIAFIKALHIVFAKEKNLNLDTPISYTLYNKQDEVVSGSFLVTRDAIIDSVKEAVFQYKKEAERIRKQAKEEAEINDKYWSDRIDACKWDLKTYSVNMRILRDTQIKSSDIPSIQTQLSDIQDFYKRIISTDTLNMVYAKEISKFKSDLVATQKNIYPKMRKAFSENANRGLWVEDIEVIHSGTTISFVGYIYANNRNIKDSYETLMPALKSLRFKRVNFKWSKGAEYTYYTITSPEDGEII